jgi:hypothetical protein
MWYLLLNSEMKTPMIGCPITGLSTLFKYTLKPFHPKYNKERLWVAWGCIYSVLVMSAWKKPLHPAAMLGLFISCMSLRTYGVVVIVSEDWCYWQWRGDLWFNCCLLGCLLLGSCWIDYFWLIFFDTCHYVNPTYVPSCIKIYSPPRSHGLKHRCRLTTLNIQHLQHKLLPGSAAARVWELPVKYVTLYVRTHSVHGDANCYH